MTHTHPVDLNKCLCHKNGIEGELSHFSLTSWNTFKCAASLRHDECSAQLKSIGMQTQRDITTEGATKHILIEATLRDLKQSVQNLNLVQ